MYLGGEKRESQSWDIWDRGMVNVSRRGWVDECDGGDGRGGEVAGCCHGTKARERARFLYSVHEVGWKVSEFTRCMHGERACSLQSIVERGWEFLHAWDLRSRKILERLREARWAWREMRRVVCCAAEFRKFGNKTLAMIILRICAWT